MSKFENNRQLVGLKWSIYNDMQIVSILKQLGWLKENSGCVGMNEEQQS